jgi:hypothetical protein
MKNIQKINFAGFLLGILCSWLLGIGISSSYANCPMVNNNLGGWQANKLVGYTIDSLFSTAQRSQIKAALEVDTNGSWERHNTNFNCSNVKFGDGGSTYQFKYVSNNSKAHLIGLFFIREQLNLQSKFVSSQ